MSRRPSNDSTKSSSSGMLKRIGKVNKGSIISNSIGGFSWDKYLQQSGMPAAPAECFKQRIYDDTMPNKFRLSDKLEAKDSRNLSAISVATVVQIEGPRLCLRLDGTDGCNNFWRLIDSQDIFPLGTCEAHGGLLQPPLGYTRNVSTWPTFLQRTLRNTNQADSDCFYEEPEKPQSNLFEIGMKLEAVDKKNPQLICPATIGDVDGDQIFVSFDGWRGAFDYWCSYDSRDLFPVGWCQRNNHSMQDPGKRGDNPIVVEKLKLVTERRKRQTRSVKSNLEQKQTAKDLPPAQVKEKPIRRRRVDSLKATASVDKEKLARDHPADDASGNSDDSISSDDSDSSPEAFQQKRHKLSISEGEMNSSDQASNKPTEDSPSMPQPSDVRQRKLERKQQRKLARVLKRAGIAQEQIGEIKKDSVSLNLTPQQVALLTSPRKRSSGADPDSSLKTKLKKKKKKRRTLEPSYTRLEGFGLKGGEHVTPNTASATSPTSPSFLEVVATSPPTSLFGGDKSRIVRDATRGWPTRLQIGSVVTSDNKLGRFDKTPVEKESDVTVTPTASSDPVTPQCVSTTTVIEPSGGPADELSAETPDRITLSPSVSSTVAVEATLAEDGSKVSSTTNSLPSCSRTSALAVNHNSNNQSVNAKVTSTVSTSPSIVKKRSRNPKKWTVDDVIDYVREKEPALQGNAHVFQKHEIDGRAFLLLNSNNIVKFMGLKLGPALKLCNVVEHLKTCVEKYLLKETTKSAAP